MRTLHLVALAAALPLTVATAPIAVNAGGVNSVFEGTIDHISTTNIKVVNPKQTLSFVLVPHFDQVFSSDGKTTYQMKNLHRGQLVKVYYDQKALGVRHADRILVLTASEQPVKKVKS